MLSNDSRARIRHVQAEKHGVHIENHVSIPICVFPVDIVFAYAVARITGKHHRWAVHKPLAHYHGRKVVQSILWHSFRYVDYEFLQPHKSRTKSLEGSLSFVLSLH